MIDYVIDIRRMLYPDEDTPEVRREKKYRYATMLAVHRYRKLTKHNGKKIAATHNHRFWWVGG